MPPSVLKGIQSLLSGIQSTCWPCGALSHYRRGGYGLNCSGMGALPPFGGSVSSANSCLGGVRGVSACILGKGVSHSGPGLQSCPSCLGDGQVSRYSLALPQPSRPHCISQRLRVSVLTASGQGTQPSACQSLPAPAPALAPLRTHSWPPVIAAYLASELSLLGVRNLGRDPVNDYIPSSPYATRWSASLQVPACCANVGD